ncbi:uncharacterized protein LOC126297747 isoform X2 [Schistocerca gregaria]|uniref:uncharacterized protein LOC126297747 isoform X2 n=1 Tax=Schistocerca gregaria TaxID=7010 RepID=UPI00211DFFEB|nr:uncharacterized protein LOC126297747 isoform X2 [Schistocerca gregaria]
MAGAGTGSPQPPREVHFWPLVSEVSWRGDAERKSSRLPHFLQRFSLHRFRKERDRERDKGKDREKGKGAAGGGRAEAAAGAKRATDGGGGEGGDGEQLVRWVPLRAKPPLPPQTHAPARRLLETSLDADATPAAAAAPAADSAHQLAPPAGAPLRAKSVEFLLDKENHAAAQPPENELQKIGCNRTMSEHQMRVQRSLQKLHVPDWYKKSTVASRPEGFLLKRGSTNSALHHWPGLGSKTTSLSSLGSTSLTASRSPTSNLLSPSPGPHVYMRWSTSRLNSGGTSASTSPCGSLRSSFNYRQPYLGWRSQERLTQPRTPAERLAAGLLPKLNPPRPPHPDADADADAEGDKAAGDEKVSNLSEVQTSIKEVTSAIVHYVSGVKDGQNENMQSSNRHSPRGSGRLCWLESSFVGSRPLDSPETPLLLTSTKTFGSDSDPTATNIGMVPIDKTGTAANELYLELSNTATETFNTRQLNGAPCKRPSPSSTTLEDVLDSLLGLPPASRSPSPGPVHATDFAAGERVQD